MATITITKAQVLDKLTAESTNASRTAKRQDGVSEFEEIMIDKQAMDSLEGAWLESFAKLTEKMHEFLTNYDNDGDTIEFEFAQIVEDGITTNILMYIVDYMMQDWLASVRPDYRQRYIDRANFEMDDLLRKLYKKESPV
jgi:hypothetical protein